MVSDTEDLGGADIPVYPFLLIEWGVEQKEAIRTAESWRMATLRRDKRLWTNVESPEYGTPEGVIFRAQNGDTVDIDLLEDACFAVHYANPTKLAYLLKMPTLRDRFRKDPQAFYERLAKYPKRKCSGMNWANKIPKWQYFVVQYWITSMRRGSRGLPPISLWSDRTIRQLLGLLPDSEASIRKYINSIGLYRPKGFSVSIVDDEFQRKKFRRVSRCYKEGVKKII